MVGAHLLLDLAGSGKRVRALKRSQSDLSTVKKVFSWYASEPEELFSRIEWFEGELLDRFSLAEGMAGSSTVIHAAARVSFNPADDAAVLEENVEGTINMVTLAADLGVSRFCHVSSIAALGDREPGKLTDEEFSWKNDKSASSYSKSKFLAEMEVWRAVHEGLPCVVVNPSVILGPGDWRNGSPRFFTTVWEGLKFYPPGSTGFVGVRDVVRAIVALTDSHDWEGFKNQRFVLSAENLSYREVFSMIAGSLNRPAPTVRAGKMMLQAGWRIASLVSRLTGKEPALTRHTARSSASDSAFDGSKITRTLDFTYTPIADAIRTTGEIFLKDHGHAG